MASRQQLQLDDVFECEALIERLSYEARSSQREVVLLLGSPNTAPSKAGEPGVLSVEGVTALIKNQFSDDNSQSVAFDEAVVGGSTERYQKAIAFLKSRRGPIGVADVIRKAVFNSQKPPLEGSGDNIYSVTSRTTEEVCESFEFDQRSWFLPPAVNAIGGLVAAFPARFGKTIVTTNFDPLIEIAIKRHGGHAYTTVMQGDGDLGQTVAQGCNVAHLHGYWRSADTLHTQFQLRNSRPQLESSLMALFRHRIVLVSGCGGWDDVLMKALGAIAIDDSADCEILWTGRDRGGDISDALMGRLEAGIARGRVTLYGGVDCHSFFPALLAHWRTLDKANEPPGEIDTIGQVPSVTAPAYSEKVLHRPARVVGGRPADRPPQAVVWVGREEELAKLRSSDAKVIAVTGIGGQGKSTLVARYFEELRTEGQFEYLIWKDCKEEAERFESHLMTIVSDLTGSQTDARQEITTIVEALTALLQNKRCLLVFDNADHYVDLESAILTGAPSVLCDRLVKSQTKSRVIFTCRPNVRSVHSDQLTLNLTGLKFQEAEKLFQGRCPGRTSRSDAEQLFSVTRGHPFWLDLIAVQIANGSNPARVIKDLATGEATEAAGQTLRSIWGDLRPKAQLVLQAMSVTLRPETELQLAEYLKPRLSFNQVSKDLKTLRNLNLIVIKPRVGSADLLELHPLVRTFVRTATGTGDRVDIIGMILKAYRRFCEAHKAEVKKASVDVLEWWTQQAELDMAAGRTGESFRTLAEVASIFQGSASPGDFMRVAGQLIADTEWAPDQQVSRAEEQVVLSLSHCLSDTGRYPDARALLDRYQASLASKSVTYIRICNERCWLYWSKGDFEQAIQWGRIGKNLQETADVQTNVGHSLALAQRDGGHVDAALTFFLKGAPLATICDPDEPESRMNGAYYGNIGRCLHLMGQIDTALICYRKSAHLLYRDKDSEHINLGFIRLWIAELLLRREDYCLALIFLRAAAQIWDLSSPPRALIVRKLLETYAQKFCSCRSTADTSLERIIEAWIFQRADETSANA